MKGHIYLPIHESIMDFAFYFLFSHRNQIRGLNIHIWCKTHASQVDFGIEFIRLSYKIDYNSFKFSA